MSAKLYFFVCSYNAYEFYERNPELRACVEQIRSGFFSPGEPGKFAQLADVLLQHDRFLHLADYDSYIEAQEKVSDVYQVCIGFIYSLYIPTNIINAKVTLSVLILMKFGTDNL